MNWRLIHLDDVPSTPWRNGGGVTRELVAWPHAGEWIWRLSVAEVASSGPFSRFDGAQRWFAVLAGAGVRLEVAGQMHTLTPASSPFSFDGADPVVCDLIDGATQDFNLMLRRGRASAQMERVSGVLKLDTGVSIVVAVYAMSAGATVYLNHEILAVPAYCLAWRQLNANVAIRVESADALWMEIAP